MELLMTIDSKDYDDTVGVLTKHTVRAVITRNGNFAMQQSKDGEYKIPGGVVENGESHLETLKRELLEEMGFRLIESSIEEIGMIIEKRKDIFDSSKKYECHTYFYKCEVEKDTCEPDMTASEIEKGFRPVWADADSIIRGNRAAGNVITSARDTLFIQNYNKFITKGE